MDYLNAFLCGGILCAIGQILIDKTPLTPARILTGYVVCGVLLTAIGVYEPIVKWGGAGATVPLLGFGYSLANGVEKAVQEQGWLGVMTGGLNATAGGIAAAVVFLSPATSGNNKKRGEDFHPLPFHGKSLFTMRAGRALRSAQASSLWCGRSASTRPS